MAKLIMVCGKVGAGKTTYSYKLSNELSAIRFSIDPWMQTLFVPDMKGLNYEWMMNRVYRCYDQIWEVSSQILRNDGNVILDLGFTEKKLREVFYKYAEENSLEPELHYLDVPINVRRERVEKRNKDKNPELYSFEVTSFMFDFMEDKFEVPCETEISDIKFIKPTS